MIRVYNRLALWGAINFIGVFVAVAININPVILTFNFLIGFALILSIGLIYNYKTTQRGIKK